MRDVEEEKASILQWVRERKVGNIGPVKKVWLEIFIGEDIHEAIPDLLFEELLAEGVEDILVRLSRPDPFSDHSVAGLWYQKTWQSEEHPEWGQGRLVVEPEIDGEYQDVIDRVSPVYLVFNCNTGNYSFKATSVKILGLMTAEDLDEKMCGNEIREVRILRTDPLNPLIPEEYGVAEDCIFESITEYDRIPSVSHSLLYLRGGIPSDAIKTAFICFPRLQSVNAVYGKKEERDTEEDTKKVPQFIRDPRVRTFVPIMTWSFFWDTMTLNIFELITSYLSFRDIVCLTQVLRKRTLVRSLQSLSPTIPASIFRSSFSHLSGMSRSYEGSILITNMEDLGLYWYFLKSGAPNLLVNGHESFLDKILTDLERRLQIPQGTGRVNGDRQLHSLWYFQTTSTILFTHHPRASITINRRLRTISLRLPVSHQAWYKPLIALSEAFDKDALSLKNSYSESYRRISLSCYFY